MSLYAVRDAPMIVLAQLVLALLLAPAPHADPAEIARAQIEATLASMEHAVLAGDADGYLKLVWQGDPCLTTEQRNWAADLKRHVPVAFDLSLGEDPPAVSDGWADAELTMAWTMPEGRDRRVSFPARFNQTDAGWLYAGEKWSVVRGDNCRVFADVGLKSVAQSVAEVMPGVRAHVESGFDLVVAHEQQVKLYTSMAHLQASIYLSYTDGLAGWNEPGEAIKILAQRRTSEGSLRVLLGHEFGHVATFEMGPRASDMPWWVLEGVAELAAEKYARSAERIENTVRRWAREGQLIEWERLADFRGEALRHQGHVYVQGHHMVGYVSGRFGRPARNTWLRLMATGKSLDDATREALGLSFAELDEQWRAALAQEEPALPADGK